MAYRSSKVLRARLVALLVVWAGLLAPSPASAEVLTEFEGAGAAADLLLLQDIPDTGLAFLLPSAATVNTASIDIQSGVVVMGAGGTGATSTVFAAVADTVYRSNDAGVTWSARGAPAPGLSVTGCGGCGATSIVYAAVGSHVHVSEDAGTTWTLAGTPAPGKVVSGVGGCGAVNIVYAAAAEQIYRSGDGGVTWEARGVPEPGVTVFGIGGSGAIQTVFAAAADTVYLSNDGAWTFSARGAPVPGGVVTGCGGSGATSTVFAAVADTVYRSNDAGLTWSARGVPVAQLPHELRLDLAADGTNEWTGFLTTGVALTASGSALVDGFNALLPGGAGDARVPLGVLSSESVHARLSGVAVEYTLPEPIPEASGDLLDEVAAIRSAMPGSGSEGFVKPTASELAAWRRMFRAMLAAEWTLADSLARVDFPGYHLWRYTDTGFGGAVHYILREEFPVTRGWGTWIVAESPLRPMAVEVPHPRYDFNTHIEGADIYRQAGARFFLMAGTHRCANAELSPCDGSGNSCGDGAYPVSDAAHFVETAFQATHEEIVDGYPGVIGVSVHGHSSASCEDVFLSNGRSGPSHAMLFAIRDSLLAGGDMAAAVSGDSTSSCTLTGGTNVQGRYTNGSEDPCGTPAATTTGTFIHIEQTRRVREDPDLYIQVVDAFKAAIPEASTFASPEPPVSALAPGLSVHPNPAWSGTTVRVTLARVSRLSLGVHDIAGRLVHPLFDGTLPAGSRDWTIPPGQLTSGVYFLVARGDRGICLRRFVVLR